MATVALVLGLVGIVFPPCSLGAIICGVIALTGARSGKAMAVVGIVLGLIVPAGYAALLYPVLGRSRAMSRQTACLSNMKQLDLALLMYVQDYDEKLPAADEWPADLLPYCKNASIYVCPSDSRSTKQTDSRFPAFGGGPIQTSYTMNQSISSAPLMHIGFPGETVSLYEGTAISGDMTSPALRHNGGLNVGFVDGHCKWFKGGSFPPPSYRGR
jgi:prepilin-type processing-associated H-X9-DG protein